MQRLAWAALALLVSCSRCGASGPTAGIRADVAFSQFHPGCLRVTASDTTEPTDPTRTTHVDLELTGADLSGTRRIAVFAGSGWSTQLTVTAEALERSCAGPVVSRQARELVLPKTGVDPESFDLTAADLDHDGYVSAQQPLPGSDCDDADPEVHPGALERCNGLDDDCDGAADGPSTTLYVDQDGDGHGRPGSEIAACGTAPGYVPLNDDCDDTPDGGEAIHPGAPERCNAVDDDCNGLVDDGLALTSYWSDQDGDGYGAADAGLRACVQPAGTVTNPTDCDDRSATVHPKPAETACDGIDDDCSGAADDAPFDVGAPCEANGCPGQKVCAPGPNATTTVCNAGPTTWYVDADHDGHGGQTPVTACVGDGGIAPASDDCQDQDPSVYDGGAEICDQKDNDCDGLVDDSPGCAGAAWTVVPATTLPAGPTTVWNTVGEIPKGSGTAVWIAGNGAQVAAKLPGANFNLWTRSCTDPVGFNFRGVWVDPNLEDGTAYLGGGTGSATGGGIRTHQLDESGTFPCSSVSTGGHDIVGVVGFGASPEVYAVSVTGETYRWNVANVDLKGLDAGTAGTGTGNVIGGSKITLTDVDGLAPNDLYAVGYVSSSLHARIFHFDGLSWTQVDLSGLPFDGVQLNAVWELAPDAVWAAGGAGLVFFFDGLAWTTLPPAPGFPTLTGVRALSPTDLYLSTASGKVLRWNGTAWSTLYPGTTALNDLAALRADDVWTVGSSNTVVHWDR